MELSAANDAIRLVTASAGAVHAQAGWADETVHPVVSQAGPVSVMPGRFAAVVTTAATTTLVSAPGGAVRRRLTALHVANRHATDANAVSVEFWDGAAAAVLYTRTLAAGESISYAEGRWVLYDATGVPVQGPASHTHAIAGAIKFALGDPGGSALTVGTKGYISIPFACTITGWRLLLDASSTTTLDVWKDTYANYPPTDADRIAGTEKPATSAAIKAEATSLSSWTTAVAAGDVLGVEVEANSAAKFAELTMLYSRTI